MQPIPTLSLDRHRHAQAASSLAPTVIIVALIMSFISVAALVTSQFGRTAGRQQGVSDTLSVADAALEWTYAAWAYAIKNNGGAYPSGTAMGAISWTSFKAAHPEFGSLYTKPTSSSPDNFITLSRCDQDGNALASGSDVVKTPGVVTQNVPGYPNWSGMTAYYKAEVGVYNNSHYATDTPAYVHAVRYFQITRASLFQNAIFYEGTLELVPGDDMVITGKVHANAPIYAQGLPSNTNSAPKLQFMNTVSSVGGFNGFANPAATKGWDGYGYGMFPPSTEKNTWADGSQTGPTDTPPANQVLTVGYVDPFGGASTNSNGLHDMVEVPTTPATNVSANDPVIYDQASLRVTIDSSKTASTTVRMDASGNTLAASDTTTPVYTISNGRTTINSPTPAQNSISSIQLTAADFVNVTAALTTVPASSSSALYDQRETSYITVTTVDMPTFARATSPAKSGVSTALQSKFNGALYIHDVSTTTKNGIRLANGRTLSQDLTIATDNGMYIQGDFNTGGSSASDVPSNGSSSDYTTAHIAPNYNENSVAVMADAVTILSNNWSDGNSSKAIGNRTATATTVNAAIVAGDVPTNYNNNKTASGGAHNFPRFLENWSKVGFTYWGSLVEAYSSEKFTSPWQTNQVYYWPDRKWNFDNTLLLDPPPFSPMAVVYSRGRWERLSN